MKKSYAMRRRFKATNARVDKLIDRYKNLIGGLWVETAQGELIDAMSVGFRLGRDGWRFEEFVADCYEDFYRRGRGEKRLVEMWGKRNAEAVNVKRVDTAPIKKLEEKIDAAFEERSRLMDDLESIGVDAWEDSEI